MKRIYKKIASLLLRAHHYIQRRIDIKYSIPPRKLTFSYSPDHAKIFHFNGNFVVGGASQLITDIIERTSHKYAHHVFVPTLPDPAPYQPLPASSYPLSQMTELYDRLKTEKPALVHIHYWIRPMHRYYDFSLWYKCVFNICEELDLRIIQNIDVPTHPYSSKNIVHNVFVSHYVRDSFNNSSIPSSVIYPGSDLVHFSSNGNGLLPENSFGMVYRFDRDKLNEEAIEIFIMAVKKKPTLICYLIGGGYYLSYYKKRVREENLERNFVFTGFVSYDSLPTWYRKLGLIVAPVHDESFGQVTPFAMSMGLPVVGYDTGAMSEILGSGKSLVPYGDKNALADLIIASMENLQVRKQRGFENQQRAKQYFSVEKMIGEYENLYNRYLS